MPRGLHQRDPAGGEVVDPALDPQRAAGDEVGQDGPRLPEGPAARVRALPELLAAARGQHARGTESDDVGDPYGRGADAFRVMAGELDPALEALVAVVRGDLSAG